MQTVTKRPFQLMVDSGSEDEPDIRYFSTLERAVEEAAKYDAQWQPFVWIIELRDHEANIVHVRDGKRETL